MQLFLDVAINGLITGTFYVLIAVGLTLIFGILKIVNFAHGEFYMLGAYAYTLPALEWGWNPWVCLLSAFGLAAVTGIIVERLLMRPLYTGYSKSSALRDEYSIIITFGLSLFLMNLATQVIGPNSYTGPKLVHIPRIELGFLFLNGERVATLGVAIAVMIALALFIRYTPWGKQIQAVAQNRFGASLSGINTARASVLVFGIGGGLAGLAGGLLAPLYHAYPHVGSLPAAEAFVVVVLGGMGSVAGSIVGGLLLGVIQALGAVYISYAYQNVFGFLLMILILLLRPWGLFGERAREV
jgi:branched-chain amino acid transport system permease protein